MDLLNFYIFQIVNNQHFPIASEICGGAESIAVQCEFSIWLMVIYLGLALSVFAWLCFKKSGNLYKNTTFFILTFLSCFYFTDYAMKQIQDPIRFGIEWFTISYYLWCFIITNIFFLSLLFFQKRKVLTLAALVITIVSVPTFSYTGRGHYEQITPIAGGLFAKFSWEFLWLSFSFKLACFLFLLVVIYGLVSLIIEWVKQGNVNPGYLTKYLRVFLLYFVIIIIPVFSIFWGEKLNEHDVVEAQNYINDIKMKVDNYFYTNGEYPKFIEKLLPEGRSPRILERHEFFTAGIRGTYYFSRQDKYCFLFQNPTREFGYYSITSEREWRYNINAGSYDDVFVNLCDESNKNFEDLISSHLGVKSNDEEFINQLTVDSGLEYAPKNMTKGASKTLQDKILERSKRDPEMKNYIKLPEKNEEDE